MPHDHEHRGATPAPEHLHSHVTADEESAEIQALAAQFIEGFRAASDKAAYLALAGVPREIESPTGGPPLKLLDLSIREEWRLGAAAPAFGGRDLSYLPYPGALVKDRINCALVYVSLEERCDLDLRDYLRQRR